jgi:hypothetical protein
MLEAGNCPGDWQQLLPHQRTLPAAVQQVWLRQQQQPHGCMPPRVDVQSTKVFANVVRYAYK